MNGSKNSKPVCAVVGVGPGNGAAFARRFSAEGWAVALVARGSALIETLAKELPGARAYACDVGDAAAVERTFAAIRQELGEVDVLIYNAGAGVFGNVEDVTLEGFESAWKVNTFGAFSCARQVIPAMKTARHGAIVLIGATSSRRGGANFAAFASAKAAQRSLGESMARHLWPQGIHVSVVIVDGVIDLERTRKMIPDKPDSFFIKPDDIADLVLSTVRQKPSAWSFEVEARPFGEKW